MDVQEISDVIRGEITRLQTALTALEGISSMNGTNGAHRGPGRPPGPRKRHMSAAARRRISAAMKRRWAKHHARQKQMRDAAANARAVRLKNKHPNKARAAAA